MSSLMNANNLIKNIKYLSHDFWETYGDNRVSVLPLLNSGPWHVLSLTAFYLYIIKIWGPQFMKNRPPYNLRWIMLIHNLFLILVNGIGLSVVLWGTSFLKLTFKCQKFDPSSPRFEDKTLFYLGYVYYISKFVDFLDTVYFVLRKKHSHITRLHVIHHSVMPFMCYIFFKFSIYTNSGFVPIINSFVHTIMYTYYVLSLFDDYFQPYLCWKKYLTQLQLIQFVLIFFHSMYFYFDSSCKSPKFLTLLQAAHAVLFFFMFSSFYISSYQKKKKVK